MGTVEQDLFGIMQLRVMILSILNEAYAHGCVNVDTENTEHGFEFNCMVPGYKVPVGKVRQ
jgi:hypothetical protein